MSIDWGLNLDVCVFWFSEFILSFLKYIIYFFIWKFSAYSLLEYYVVDEPYGLI
jgi:hypothetical protein